MKSIVKIIVIVVCLLFNLLATGCGGSGDTAATSAVIAKTPDIPTGVIATSSINKITITWSPVTGADSYNVYWSTNPGVTPATGTKLNVSKNDCQHVGLYISQTYFYVVTAVNSTGESPPSNQAATVVATDGANLYATYCLSCHGPVTSTSIVEGTVGRIKTAISENKGGMGVLSALSDDQLLVISQQLPCH